MKREKAIKYLKLARYQADLFSKDPHTKVACIILSPSLVVLSTGYNGLPSGMSDNIPSRWERPVKLKYVSHAESNSICSAARYGTRLDGGIAVVTMYPCNECARSLIQAGIKTIVATPPDYHHPRWGESFKISTEMFQEVGINVVIVEEHELI